MFFRTVIMQYLQINENIFVKIFEAILVSCHSTPKRRLPSTQALSFFSLGTLHWEAVEQHFYNRKHNNGLQRMSS